MLYQQQQQQQHLKTSPLIKQCKEIKHLNVNQHTNRHFSLCCSFYIGLKN